MEENIIISNLNDYIFCPRSIYFHNLYSHLDEHMYHSTYQSRGKAAHKNIDSGKYSSRKNILAGLDVYSEELGLIGKIDLYDSDSKTLIERKNTIKKIYDGYLLQVYAQYFCMCEMGFEITGITLRSLTNNKSYTVPLPREAEKLRLKEVILEMRNFSLEDKTFLQNPNKCRMCVYKELCDYYKDDE